MFSLIRSTSPGWPSFTRDDGGSLVGWWIPPVDVFEDKDSVQIAVERAKPRQSQVTVESK